MPAGQSVALIGHNGSGKSTFLRMAAALLEPSDGEVEIAGWPAGRPEARATTSFLPDEPVLYDDLSVREHGEYISRLHGGPGWDDYCEELAERLSLTRPGRRSAVALQPRLATEDVDHPRPRSGRSR